MIKNDSVKESVGIACERFIAALRSMGLATLTCPPSPATWLPVDFPALSDLRRKSREAVAIVDPVALGP